MAKITAIRLIVTLAGNQPSVISSLVDSPQKEFALRDMGPASYFLGIQFLPHPQGCVLSQAKYIVDLLHWTKMDGAAPYLLLWPLALRLARLSP